MEEKLNNEQIIKLKEVINECINISHKEEENLFGDIHKTSKRYKESLNDSLKCLNNNGYVEIECILANEIYNKMPKNEDEYRIFIDLIFYLTSISS